MNGICFRPEALSQEYIYKQVQKDSWKAQFADYRTFHHLGKGRIDVLIGPSSMGKTSIVNALKCLQRDICVRGLDIQTFRMSFDFLFNNCREEVDFLNSVLETREDNFHLLHAIFWKIFNFKNDVSKNNKEKAIHLSAQLNNLLGLELRGTPFKRETFMMEEVFLNSLKGKNTILDVLTLETIFHTAIRSRFKAEIRIALVYCPLKVLVKRIEERNERALKIGSYHELRRGLFPLFQFANLFRAKAEEGEISLGVIYREDIEEAFMDYFGQPIENEEERARAKASLLEAFGFKNESINRIEITPKYDRYDYIFNTNEASSEEFARILNQ